MKYGRLAYVGIGILSFVFIINGCTEANKAETKTSQAASQSTESSASQSQPTDKEQIVVSDSALRSQEYHIDALRTVKGVPHAKGMPESRLRVPVIPEINHETYLDNTSNGIQQVAFSPLSTFSIDVDTGSYTNVRRYLNMGQLPPKDAVREEAFINYFMYEYPVPETKAQPFSVNTEIAPAPWNEKRQLLRIGLKGYEIPVSERKSSNLVFLIDVSGSMNQPDKLPLLKQSLLMLTKELNENDRVSIVTYAGSASVVLKPTKGSEKQAIINALTKLTAGGSTYGQSGIEMAYQQAKLVFIKGGVNRIMLATDGDFNVGVTDLDTLKELVKNERINGITLTTLGFGQGNYNDAMMEQLADIGNGSHVYIDSIHEARKVFQNQMSGTLQAIAYDVKVQVEFNPQTVKEYRLIGYQNRLLKSEDFNNDHVDAGEIGAGHTVTALYELTLKGEPGQIDDLRYKDTSNETVKHELTDELALVKLRYKLPEQPESRRLSYIVKYSDIRSRFQQSSPEFQFATSVAAFAQKLKGNDYLHDMSYQEIADIARKNKGIDPYNYRGEFISLIDVATSL